MSTSDFNPDEFLSGTTLDEPLSTVATPVPEGTYRGQVDNVTARRIDGPTPRIICEVTWELLDEAVRAELERDKVTVRQDIWLDLDSNGALDKSKGKNVGLGRLREALGQNEMSGWTFSSMKGQMATVRVSHRSDKDDPTIKYAQVARVTALA